MSKVVVVTGGASGIGEASARRFAAGGWTVEIADRVLVMVHGRTGRTIAREKLDEEAVNLAVQGAG